MAEPSLQDARHDRRTEAATDGGAPVIQVDGVAKTYNGRRGKETEALAPTDLTVRHGEFVSIVGPSGCGKSTFLRILGGILPPTRGSVSLRVNRDRPAVGMVFQDYSILPWLSVRKNVRIGLELQGVPRRQADQRAMEWIARLGLSGFEDAYPDALSGGMKQRVAIARALTHDPQILLLDEPFAALDAQLRRILQDELLNIWATSPRTAVLVTHSLEEAILLTDRVVVMGTRPGRIVGEFPVPFARPRQPQTRFDPDFIALEAQIWGVLSDEVRRSMT
jgi:NitT/TauT family transport system ATP-binding protein